MDVKSLLRQQLDRKMFMVINLKNIQRPPTGWVKAVRSALGISLQQLGHKMSLTKQSVHELEIREKDYTITLKTLNEAANALDMELVYAFIPKDGTLDRLIERKTKDLATKIVLQTSHNMKLEDQENSEERIKKAIEERAEILKNEMPKILWD